MNFINILDIHHAQMNGFTTEKVEKLGSKFYHLGSDPQIYMLLRILSDNINRKKINHTTTMFSITHILYKGHVMIHLTLEKMGLTHLTPIRCYLLLMLNELVANTMRTQYSTEWHFMMLNQPENHNFGQDRLKKV
ncbi:hypothetical protein ACJX0J_018526, partial [Zea mays]